MLDEKLNFKDNINYAHKVAISNLTKICDFDDKHFGMPTHLAINIYTSYIRPVMEYSYVLVINT